MNLMIVLGGLLLLAALAVVIGGGADTQARDQAWRRIAEARRRLGERERALHRCLDKPRCDSCPLDRFR